MEYLRRSRVVLIGFLVLVSCGNQGSGLPEGDRPVNWDNPINGVRVNSLSDITPQLPFAVHVPKGLGQAMSMFIAPPGARPVDRVVAFVYETSKYGRVIIEEHIPDVPVEDYNRWSLRIVAENGKPYTHGSAAIVTIRDGTSALVTTSEDGSQSTIFWLEASTFEIIVEGPTLNAEQGLEIANSL